MSEEPKSYDLSCQACGGTFGVIITKDRDYTFICVSCFDTYTGFRRHLKNVTDEMLVID